MSLQIHCQAMLVSKVKLTVHCKLKSKSFCIPRKTTYSCKLQIFSNKRIPSVFHHVSMFSNFITCTFKNTTLRATWSKNHVEKPSHCSHFPKKKKKITPVIMCTTAQDHRPSPTSWFYQRKRYQDTHQLSDKTSRIKQVCFSHLHSFFFRDENYLYNYTSYNRHKQRTPVLQTLHFQKLHSLPFGGNILKQGK